MRRPIVLRKRYIPWEVTDISGDKLLFRSDELLVTEWTPLKPRSDFSRGVSYTFLKEGYKLGKFFDAQDNFLYWYCDIIDVLYDAGSDTFTINDLLLDIKIKPDGRVVVLDAGELADALAQGLVSAEQACRALKTMDKLLDMIYGGRFPPDSCNELGF